MEAAQVIPIVDHLRSSAVRRSLKEVFRRPGYVGLAVFVAIFIALLAILLPNISFLRHIADSNVFSAGRKAYIFWTFLGSFKTNLTIFGQITTISVAILTGINVAMFVFYLRKRVIMQKAAGTSVLGIISGLVGVGCASCGSVLLSSIFGIGATSSFVGLFPLKGAEFGILGIILLLVSNYLIARKLQDPFTCKIECT